MQHAVHFGQNVTFSETHVSLCLCTEVIHCEKMLGVGFSWRWQLQCAVPAGTHGGGGHWMPGALLGWVSSERGCSGRCGAAWALCGGQGQARVGTDHPQRSIHAPHISPDKSLILLTAFLLLAAFQACFIASILIPRGSKQAE